MAPATSRPSPPSAPDRDAKPHITIRGVSKQFERAVVYDNFDLDIPRGKFLSIFGPNGCGKSTLINMIAGLVCLGLGTSL